MRESFTLIVLFGSVGVAAADVDYVREIKPLLAARCTSCHGALRQRSALRVDTIDFLKKGGKAGPAVVPGKSDESVVVEAITGDGRTRMPPIGEGEPLTDAQIATIKKWIDEGAKGPPETAPPDPRGHWAFQPPKRATPPDRRGKPGGSLAVGNEIDAFLEVERAKAGVSARAEADRRTLIRRVYLDLVGLPPTPAEVAAFLADPSPDAYEKVVDRLLASPRYGERWGRHWMDVWRYSDWDGYGNEIRNSQAHIWHWRDWIVESLNADKGYDRMVLEMLAADELAPADADALRATGFLARNWFKFNRNIWLEHTIEHTAKAFLAMTVNCARCHDHMYDPISQREYYEFRAIFEPHDVRTDRVPGQADVAKDGIPRVFDANPQAPTYRFERGDEARPDKAKALKPGLPEIFGANWACEPVSLPITARNPDRRDFVRCETLAASAVELRKARATRERAVRFAFTAPVLPPDLPSAVLAVSRVPRSRDILVLAEADLALAEAKHSALVAVIRAEELEDAGQNESAEWKETALAATAAQRKAALLESKRNLLACEQELAAAAATVQESAANTKIKAAKTAIEKAETDLKKPATTAYTPRAAKEYPATSTGRRLALARWIASPQNPLTARVAVNHIWMRHFGRPLVPTVFDFGRNGQPPTDPALLDWVATELVRLNWSMKKLHKVIVMSAAFQMDSTPDAAALARDPDNRRLWRFPTRRLEAEAVRDAVLAASGALDERLGGPDLDQSLGLTVPRRSLYFRHSVEKYVEMLKVFDAANVVECYRRDESIVPQQALALANSSLVLAQSRRLARALSERHADPAAFVAAAFERVLGRPPKFDEAAECARFLADQATRLADPTKLTAFASGPPCGVPASPDPAQRARENLVHVLFNHHEFVTIR